MRLYVHGLNATRNLPEITEMNAIAKFQEMQVFAEKLTKLGYEICILQDGKIDVQDPVRVNGEIAYYDTHRLHTPRQARKFISDRS
jgi:hypothetical protein|nr:MAG TPA: hypothetical protein [Caudoviricetes sp.]